MDVTITKKTMSTATMAAMTNSSIQSTGGCMDRGGKGTEGVHRKGEEMTGRGEGEKRRKK